MTSGNDLDLNYQQAQTAYIQGNYQEAAETIDRLIMAEPDNAKARLLRGHVYHRLQDYALAQAEYESVLQMSTDLEIRAYAQSSLEEIRYAQTANSNGDLNLDEADGHSHEIEMLTSESIAAGYEDDAGKAIIHGDEVEIYSIAPIAGGSSWDENMESYEGGNDYYVNPFDNTVQFPSNVRDLETYTDNDGANEITYKLNPPAREITDYISAGADDMPYWTESDDFTDESSSLTLDRQKTMILGSVNDPSNSIDSLETDFAPIASGDRSSYVNEIDSQPSFGVDESPALLGLNKASLDDSESFEPMGSNWQMPVSQEPVSDGGSALTDDSNPFLEGFGEFNDLATSATEPKFSPSESEADWKDLSGNLVIQNPSPDMTDSYMLSQPSISSNDNFTVTTSTGSRSRANVSSITGLGPSSLEPRVTVKQGWLRPVENASLKKKSWLIAIASGVTSTVLVSIIAAALSSGVTVSNKGWNLWQRNVLIGLGAGAASFGTTLGLMNIVSRSIRRSTEDLDAKLQDGIQGNFNTTAIVFSEDEFGRLATRFNQMAGVMLAITSEAQRKAQEEEQKKEDLQRQVIRLLDDVEGAARGDLTVQAEVTADVLGAVADSFNLTIENLREIVQQVKTAAQQVNQESTASEVFARNLSGEALRQAEELAVTLNSVQVITDSIKRVADNAKEAENVARSASLTALKGGDAVEKTVEGILGIRETVAESTRKVKRLAESSQEISKIVGVISQIASRTNMLALNASIEAARAGEAGRGFAIVADEVRQLADRSAKALKEIEQIVRQIQSDTGSVMTAMEEGTQQVIEGTKLAEKAKRSLEDIITVSNRIDSLVQSITADTVEQTQTSTTVAQVMQSVEMTAQATSQEAQRVSGTLQNLVSVAQDLLNSVERFRVENN